MLTKAEINKIVEQIVMRTQPQKVIIFGSYAKGTATIKSDLDIFIIKDTNLPMMCRTADLLSLFNNSLIPIDMHIYTSEEVEELSKEPFSFVHNILKTGRVLFDQ